MVPILVQSLVLLMASLAHAEVIAGTNFDGKNWEMIANFRGGAGLTTSNSSTNTFVLTLTNGPTWVSGIPGRGNAINFDGTNDVVVADIGFETRFDYSQSSTFTVMVLFTNPSGGNGRVLVSKVNFSVGGWVVRTGAGVDARPDVLMRRGTGYQYVNATGVTDAMIFNDAWHTIGFIYRGIFEGTGNREIYFDGVSYPVADEGADLQAGDILNDVSVHIGNIDTSATLTNMIDKIGCVMVSRSGYAPTAEGMKSLHNRLMGQVSNGAE